jgi:hypothetical protein
MWAVADQALNHFHYVTLPPWLETVGYVLAGAIALRGLAALLGGKS